MNVDKTMKHIGLRLRNCLKKIFFENNVAGIDNFFERFDLIS